MNPALLQDGDIVLQRSLSSQAEALAAATGSPWTHTGIVFRRGAELAVIEAVGPVRWTPLADWVARGAEGDVIVLRPRAPFDAAAVRRAAEAYLGAPYDLLFRWSDERVYCSELVYKAYDRVGLHLGALVPISTLDLRAPAVQRLIDARGRSNLDPAELVVTPASLLVDPDLQLVFTSD